MTRLGVLAGCLLLALAACGDSGGTATTTVATVIATTTTTAVVTTVPVDATTVPTTGVVTTVDDGVLLIEVGQSGDLFVLVEGEPVEVGDRISVPAGATVRLAVVLEGAEEVHVHTYDLVLEVVAGEEATLDFVADISGIFEVELEGAGTLLFELEVA